jgi:hypothetical protein
VLLFRVRAYQSQEKNNRHSPHMSTKCTFSNPATYAILLIFTFRSINIVHNVRLKCSFATPYRQPVLLYTILINKNVKKSGIQSLNLLEHLIF